MVFAGSYLLWFYNHFELGDGDAWTPGDLDVCVGPPLHKSLASYFQERQVELDISFATAYTSRSSLYNGSGIADESDSSEDSPEPYHNHQDMYIENVSRRRLRTNWCYFVQCGGNSLTLNVIPRRDFDRWPRTFDLDICRIGVNQGRFFCEQTNSVVAKRITEITPGAKTEQRITKYAARGCQ